MDTNYFLDRKFIASFNARLDRDSVPGCHLWTGSLVDGYGQVRTSNPLQMRKAHSVALEIHLGRRLGPGKGTHSDRLQANHRDELCQHKHCCNPDHLYEGTQAENMRDSRLKHPREPVTHCPRGHLYDGTYSSGVRYCKLCHKNAIERSVARKLAGLIGPDTRGRKPKLVCNHGPEAKSVDSRGYTACIECRKLRRRSVLASR